jgi:tyrosyl-tRNA synthetase
MSKSLGNYIGLTFTPEDMFGKIMSIPDALIEKYLTLLTRVPDESIRDLLAPGKNPRDAKAFLARTLVDRFRGPGSGAVAEESFKKVFSQKELPESIEDVDVGPEKEVWIVTLILTARFAPSGSEARRLITQGAVTLDGKAVTDPQARIVVRPGIVLQVGKRRFARIRIGQPGGR